MRMDAKDKEQSLVRAPAGQDAHDVLDLRVERVENKILP